MDFILNIIQTSAITIPVISIATYVFQYYKADYLIRFFYTKPHVDFFIKIIEIIGFILSIFITIGCFIGISTMINIPKTPNKPVSSDKIYTTLIVTIFTFGIINYFAINTINRYSQKYKQIKKTPFYTLNKYTKIPDLKRNTKIYLISNVDKNNLLIAYYIKNKLYRRIVDKNILQNIPILTEETPHLMEDFLPLNESVQKTKNRTFFAYVATILISLSIGSIDRNIYFGIAIFIELQFFLLPTTKKLFLDCIKKRNNKNNTEKTNTR